jgi:hypothetical protein
MMLPIGKKINKGFLLVEAMSSVLIVSVGLIVILTSFTRSIRAMDISEDYFKAGLLIEQKIYEIGNGGMEYCLREGDFTDFSGDFSWRAESEKLEQGALNEVALKVLWDKRNVKREFVVRTYLK